MCVLLEALLFESNADCPVDVCSAGMVDLINNLSKPKVPINISFAGNVVACIENLWSGTISLFG